MLLSGLLANFQSLPLLPTSTLGPSGADSQVGGFVYVQDPVGLSKELSCEAGSFYCLHNHHRFLQSEVLRLYFPKLEPWVVWSVLLPSCSSQFMQTQTWDHLVLQPLPCCVSSSTWLAISGPSTGLDECVFVNFLAVRFAYSLIFWQFWLFFVFKFVVVLLVVQGGTEFYLCLHLGQNES